MMSKLEYVLQALKENSNILIVGIKEQTLVSPYNDSWNHTVACFVAPKLSLSTAKELQQLMVSLIPNLQPNCQDNFREGSREMEFGKLYFDETIGVKTTHREITITDSQVSLPINFVDGKLVIDETTEIKRRIWVKLYPTTTIATNAYLNGVNEHYISKRLIALSSR